MITDSDILDAACMYIPSPDAETEKEIIRLVNEALEYDGSLTITDMHPLEYVVRNTVESLLSRMPRDVQFSADIETIQDKFLDLFKIATDENAIQALAQAYALLNNARVYETGTGYLSIVP